MNRPYAAKLQELLQASFNLPNAVCDLGRVELGPAELVDVTYRIYDHDKAGIDAKAHYLLAASGFDAEQVLSDIAQIKFTNQVDSKTGEPIVTPQLPGSTKAKATPKSNILDRSVHSIITQTTRDFDEFIGKQLKVDWTARKQEIWELIGRNSGNTDSNGRRINKLNNISRSERPGLEILGPDSNEPAKLTPLMRSYAEIVMNLSNNDWIMPDIVSKFAQASYQSSQLGSSTSSYVQDSWRALDSPTSLAFLEMQYRDYIDSEIKTHRHEAKLGGVPSSFNKIKAFVSLRYFRNGSWDSKLVLVNKTPIWAYLYYLVRSGHLDEALQVVLERKDIFETMGSSFALYFKAWVDSPTHTLSPHYSEMIQAEYHHLFRPGTHHFDPYKQALYKVIGRCDLSKRSLPLVAVTTEDWLWLQLRLCQQNSPYTFEKLQEYIQEIGPLHLAQNPHKYFTILVVLKLYAPAISFLRSHDEVHAVHFAIALVALKLLKPDETQSKEFNRLIGGYTRHFRKTLPSLAVDYLILIAALGPGSYSACYEALQELVLKTGRFSELLGDVQTLSDRTVTGSIEKRSSLIGLADKRAYLSTIAQGAASKANDDGRVVDAIMLYRLAGEPDRVLKLLNSQLGLMLTGIQLGQPVSASISPSMDILQLAKGVMREDGDVLAKSPNRDTCLLLLAIAECLDLIAQQQWQQCLERIQQTGLLVLSPEPAVSQVRELAQQFLCYDESIARNIPCVLLMALTCILKITESLKSQGIGVAGRLIDQYRGRSNNCMVYAGLIQFRMPREVYAKLTQLEAQLA